MIRVAFLIWIFILAVLHSGVVQRPIVHDTGKARAVWSDRSQNRIGIHQAVLEGAPYERGLRWGEMTKHLLLEQEDALNDQLDPLLPAKWMRQLAVLGLIGYFQGIDRHYPPEHIEEMFGVSKFAPKKFDYLADGFTRQIAYHGLHEVGQMMVDQGFEGMGCTVAAIKRGKNWIVGRNFDFEGGRIFDKEKVMKWVFPDRGYAFVSVIWAGMVGGVTGVNEKGVYISINAAGSDDFARVGTPSTLVIAKVLQEAATSEEAVRILREARMFITDIFVVNDAAGNLTVVEKSPARFDARAVTASGVVANHLTSEVFRGDRRNENRKAELTTLARLERGQRLIDEVPLGLDLDGTTHAVLDILRDKGDLPLGNRRAIDALIATHAVIHDGVRGYFYVSRGPGLSGTFEGFDLKKSFAQKSPAWIGALKRDPQVSDEDFHVYKQNVAVITDARRLIRRGQCAAALAELGQVEGPGREQTLFYHALGDAQECANLQAEARESWRKALELKPAYAKEERALKRSLER